MNIRKLNSNNEQLKFIVKVIFFTIFIAVGTYHIRRYVEDKTTQLHFSGRYQLDDGEWVTYRDFSEVKEPKEKLVIEGTIEQKIGQREEIMLFLYHVSAKIYENGVLVYSGNDNRINQWDSYFTDGLDIGDEIRIELHLGKKEMYSTSCEMFLTHLCFGTKYELLMRQLRANYHKILLGIFILIMGHGTLISMLALRFLKVSQEKGYFICALLLISGALCSIMDYEYITLICPHAYFINKLDLILQICICEFLFLYLKLYLRTTVFVKIMKGMNLFWLVVVAAYFVFDTLGIQSTFTKNFGYNYCIINLGIEIIMLFFDYKKYNETRTKFVLVSGIGLAFFTAVEIVHYYVTHVYWRFIFEYSLFVFTIVQYLVLIMYTREGYIQSARVKELEKENILQRSKAIEMESELVRNRMAIMLSQIRPHFLYNALGTIGALCLDDPKQARCAVDHFTKYLRSNMESLEKNACIPFKEELVHVKNYLYIEQLRFGENLHIEYDIHIENFSCPALMLQTIVENAIKHGVRKRKGKGTVWIRTMDYEKGYCVIVEDDGVGFDKTQVQNDGMTHIGLKNTKRRLEAMCNGKIAVESELGKGTKVTILIPE